VRKKSEKKRKEKGLGAIPEDAVPRALLAKVDCTQQQSLCQEQNVMGFPTVRIHQGHQLTSFREYDGDRTTHDLVEYVHKTMPSLEGFTEDEEYEELRRKRETEMSKDMEKRLIENGDNHGCNVVGTVNVMKVPGTLVLSAHSNYKSLSLDYLNMSHIIHHMALRSVEDRMLSKLEEHEEYVDAAEQAKRHYDDFGVYSRKIMREHKATMEATLPDVGMESVTPFLFPLNGKRFSSSRVRGALSHYIKTVHTYILPSSYSTGFFKGSILEMYQHQVHSQTDAVLPIGVAPSLNFSYDISPLAYELSGHTTPLADFLTQLCAIIGGVFTVIGLIDNVIYHGAASLLKYVK